MAVNRQMSMGNSVLVELQNMLPSEIEQRKYARYVHAENLLQSIYECYQEGKFCDVTLIVGSEAQIKAHKVVLSSCSEYFKGLLDLRWNKSEQDAIVIQDFDVETLKSVLKFAYTGELEVNRGNVLKLLTAGDFLQMDFIKESCGIFLQPTVNLENCLLLLATANKFNAVMLVNVVVEYIANNYYSVSQSENFLQLPVELLIEVLQSESLIVDKGEKFLALIAEQERYVLESVLNYISHQAEVLRARSTIELLKNVRLLLLPASSLDSLVKNEHVSSCFEAKNLVANALGNLNATDSTATTTDAGDEKMLPDFCAKQREATKARARWYKIHLPYHAGGKKVWFDDYEIAGGDETYLTGMKLWMALAYKDDDDDDDKMYICGMKLFYSNGATSLYGSHDTDHVQEFHLEEGERIVKATVCSAWTLTKFTFHTSKDRELGPFGDSTWGDSVFTEEPGPYGFLGYMRGSVVDTDSGVLFFSKFSLIWKEFMLRGPYDAVFEEEHEEVQSLDYDSDSQYILHPELLDSDDGDFIANPDDNVIGINDREHDDNVENLGDDNVENP